MGQVATELARRASVPLMTVGRAELITRDDAGRFLEACQKEGALIVGIEGFRIIGDRVEPDISSIADFSGLDDPVRSVTEARRFIESSKPDLAFDFSVRLGEA